MRKTLPVLLVFTFLVGVLTWNVGCKKTQSCIDTTKVTSGYYNCGTIYDPVCGCDNVTYQNTCAAQNRGVVQWIQGPCP